MDKDGSDSEGEQDLNSTSEFSGDENDTFYCLSQKVLCLSSQPSQRSIMLPLVGQDSSHRRIDIFVLFSPPSIKRVSRSHTPATRRPGALSDSLTAVNSCGQAANSGRWLAALSSTALYPTKHWTQALRSSFPAFGSLSSFQEAFHLYPHDIVDHCPLLLSLRHPCTSAVP
ncbi:hypothetical protein CPC08DRAFT_439254 [Agrocybe pediades]|nr:hypothetical protein CPC08DRAFT_439254 [Agrocybe pediades]